VCDNLVEETGLCAQYCLETENIFCREDLDSIIQANRSDLSYLSCSTCDGPNSVFVPAVKSWILLKIKPLYRFHRKAGQQLSHPKKKKKKDATTAS